MLHTESAKTLVSRCRCSAPSGLLQREDLVILKPGPKAEERMPPGSSWSLDCTTLQDCTTLWSCRPGVDTQEIGYQIKKIDPQKGPVMMVRTAAFSIL
jgi:hypothetical protein